MKQPCATKVLGSLAKLQVCFSIALNLRNTDLSSRNLEGSGTVSKGCVFL
jgi:hypothetical protein